MVKHHNLVQFKGHSGRHRLEETKRARPIVVSTKRAITYKRLSKRAALKIKSCGGQMLISAGEVKPVVSISNTCSRIVLSNGKPHVSRVLIAIASSH